MQHTWYFQPTRQLDELVAASRSHPVVVLKGVAGAGKSTLAAALARPEVAGGRIPDGFAHAVAILGGKISTECALASDLKEQLERSLPGFVGAVAEFERSVPRPQRNALDPLPQMVLRPLAYLAGPPEVRIVLDGFDQLPNVTREAVGEALAAPGPSAPGHHHAARHARMPAGASAPPRPDPARRPRPLPDKPARPGCGAPGHPRPGRRSLARRLPAG